jgi:hypothetical protein
MPEIIFEAQFDEDVERLGGYQAIDLALESIMEGLGSNPKGFELFESVYTSFRYAITQRVQWTEAVTITPLLVIFTIDAQGDVHLQHVETYSGS